jgi:hypothetical protein
MLHAIGRLAPSEIVPLQLISENGFNIIDLHRPSPGRSSNPGVSPTSHMPKAALSLRSLPPFAEVSGYIDSYFRYFRE